MKDAVFIFSFVVACVGIGAGMTSSLVTGCGQEWFPTCKDPKHPCPDVQPDYPPPTPFGAQRDGGREAGARDPGDRF